MYRLRRSYDLEKQKDIAMRFVTYLETFDRKKTMKTSELREIYRKEFSVNYEVNGMPFSSALNCLCFHLNICQQVLGRVVFGGGEEAALVMFSADSNDEDEWDNDLLTHSYPCRVCRKPMPSQRALLYHQSSINHRQQIIFREIRKSLERHDLINDKNGIILTSAPQGDKAGVIETILKPGMSAKTIVLTVENIDRRTDVRVKDITLLWSTSLFDYSDIREIAHHKRTIGPGCKVQFVIDCSPREEYGYSYVPAVLRFEKDDLEFHILRFLSVRSVSDIFDDLKKTEEYVGPTKHQPVPKDVRTFPGKDLPPPVSIFMA